VGEPLLQPIVAAMTKAIPQRRSLIDAIFADGPCSVFETDTKTPMPLTACCSTRSLLRRWQRITAFGADRRTPKSTNAQRCGLGGNFRLYGIRIASNVIFVPTQRSNLAGPSAYCPMTFLTGSRPPGAETSGKSGASQVDLAGLEALNGPPKRTRHGNSLRLGLRWE
jgi:hypothetical protein